MVSPKRFFKNSFFWYKSIMDVCEKTYYILSYSDKNDLIKVHNTFLKNAIYYVEPSALLYTRDALKYADDIKIRSGHLRYLHRY